MPQGELAHVLRDVIGVKDERLLVGPETLDDAGLGALVEQFHIQHQRLNGYASREHPVQVVTLRRAVVVARGLVDPEPATSTATPATPRPVARREVWFESVGLVSTPVYERTALDAGASFEGPAVVSQMDVTTLVPPAHVVHVNRFAHLVIEAAQ